MTRERFIEIAQEEGSTYAEGATTAEVFIAGLGTLDLVADEDVRFAFQVVPPLSADEVYADLDHLSIFGDL